MWEWIYSTARAEHRQQMEVSAQVHVPAALSTEISHLHPLNESFGGCQGRSGRYVEEKIFPLPGIELQSVGVDHGVACN